MFRLLTRQLVGLRSHDEIVLVEALDDVSPPLDIQIGRNTKMLVYRR